MHETASRARLMRSVRRSCGAALVAVVVAAAAPAAEAPKPAASPLVLAAIAVAPPSPGADTLCQLRVEVANKGDRIASQLAFTVKVNGQELPVYRNQLFMQRLDPGKTATVRLYNFWTTETSRPAPADGKYRVEVTLREAKWYEIATKDGVEEWTPRDPVPGLPVTATVVVGK
ncbi:MAG TPA: hypothetical protein VGS57_13640 [Thermoanaerobaculia bacterium]|jgi:hypothetical protein|nr:hypothetical protein [Thermoanaerobaculia bacterium]